MKYERLTNRGEPFYGFEKCKTCEYGKDGCDNWCDQITGCFCRLQEIEDKIESGELISTKQVGDTEIEFFVKHNESVRKNTAQDIFSWIYKNLVNLNFITGNVEINLSALNDFAKTYGVDVFDIFKQGGEQ